MQAELKDLEKQAEDPTIWDDPQSAQKLMKKIAALRNRIESWEILIHRLADARELAEMDDESIRADLEKEAAELAHQVHQKELNTMLSGEYDQGDALLTINAGAGGTDSQDWSQMLQRMYLRWAERRGYQTEILDITEGEEAGIKSVTIAVNGRYAYGYLRPEKGVHRLVRLSPFDSNNRRHTSFTQVEVLPQVEDDTGIELDPTDLKIETFRAGGAGGQNVQKNDTAVRITHIPSGIVASCQNERSQTQNKENALKVLKGRLLELKQQEEESERAKLRGEYQKAEWGSQIRSYVLHPYQMVKDHRTNFEVGNAQSVLDGDLDGFIEAYLQSQVGGT
ncbi:MAG: peptide chain release factor 2 [Anaerolineales bacterium]|nr:peptide chain release factor 2 [Anaerolineales bacterium]